MDSIVNKFGQGYDTLKKAVNNADKNDAAKAAAAGAAGAVAGTVIAGPVGAAAGAGAAAAASLIKSDNAKVPAQGKSGKATATLSLPELSTKEMQKNWDTAAKGAPAKGIQSAVAEGSSASVAVAKYVKGNPDKFDSTQRNRIADFMQDVKKFGKVDSKDSNLTGKDLIDVINGGIKDKGITEDQLEAIANGEFNVAAYADMVKDGRSIA